MLQTAGRVSGQWVIKANKFVLSLKTPLTMSHVELILEEISDEVEQVHYELSNRMKRAERALEILEKYRGRGAGGLEEGAQEYVNALRNDDRF